MSSRTRDPLSPPLDEVADAGIRHVIPLPSPSLADFLAISDIYMKASGGRVGTTLREELFKPYRAVPVGEQPTAAACAPPDVKGVITRSIGEHRTRAEWKSASRPDPNTVRQNDQQTRSEPLKMASEAYNMVSEAPVKFSSSLPQSEVPGLNQRMNNGGSGRSEFIVDGVKGKRYDFRPRKSKDRFSTSEAQMGRVTKGTPPSGAQKLKPKSRKRQATATFQHSR
ncbi:hypothetical protein C1H76_7467 [Elsinoe australis]|uniref:Uncharacterized protein n=1 Tax=Elsinoe australis TaxID=40998 RepID=A0A4U7AQ73_9PEZI|nr:hypothetical protein C1H76_7467 [Elsinoe australis]